MEIALAYKRKKMEEETMQRDEDKLKAKKLAKMINSQGKKPSHDQKMSPVLVSRNFVSVGENGGY